MGGLADLLVRKGLHPSLLDEQPLRGNKSNHRGAYIASAPVAPEGLLVEQRRVQPLATKGTHFIFRYRRISAFVEESCFRSVSVAACNSGTIRCASTLPNSTPHWSNELIDQMTP